MDKTALKAIVKSLQFSEVDFIIVGGIAVLAHGHVRFTNDLDLVIRFSKTHLKKAFEALVAIGYKPMAPVTSEQFSDEETRKSWVATKNMIVMNLYSDEHKGTPVDLFIEEPFDFDLEFDKADTHTFDDGLSFKVVQLDTLIAMKEKVGRPNDMDDVKHLKRIKNNLS